jgi:hypothetical protein
MPLVGALATLAIGYAACEGDDPAIGIAALDSDAQVVEGDVAELDDGDASPAAESAIAPDEAGPGDATTFDATDDHAREPNDSSATPALCVRLENPLLPAGTAQLSLMVQRAYVAAVYQDCDVGQMIAADEDTLSDFQNALIAWNLQFWGCNGQTTTTLGIVRAGFDGVTAADVDRLVDHYVAAATEVLSMSSPEALSMREAFAELAAAATLRASNEFSLSRCDTLDAAAADAPEGGVEGGGS